MAVQKGLGDDHEVLSRDAYCSGYVDSFGKWNNGFACPKLEEEPVFCCGTSTYRYCCTTREHTDPGGDANTVIGDNLPLVLGVAVGAVVTIALVTIISCCLCKGCLCYKKRGGGKRDSLHSPTAANGVTNMYSYSSASLGRRDGRSGRQELEDMLQDVDEVAVTRQSRSSNLNGVGSLPRTFTSYRTNRVSFTDSVGNSSVSTTTDNERQLFIEQSAGLPPPYNFNKLSGFEEPLPVPYPRPFTTSSGELGSGHYIAGMSPNDSSFYGANKL
ncbi:protein shisa-2 homolog [Pollicipes pollicipes]|uniref:protein shisa-2 homolog n=1 Tax=Pollicipes pollicipes TaxID=41117 RepID=UPI00188514BD|nr:protein shisa-2 homolog [Pollicipes pollicipes]